MALEKAAREKAAQEEAALEKAALEQTTLEEGTTAMEHNDDNAGNQTHGASRKRRRNVDSVPGLWLLCIIANSSSSVRSQHSCR